MVPALLGSGLVVLALGLHLGRCDSFGLLTLEVMAFLAGTALVGAAVVLRLRPGVAMSVLILIGIAAIAFLVASLAIAASFSRCYEL